MLRYNFIPLILLIISSCSVKAQYPISHVNKLAVEQKQDKIIILKDSVDCFFDSICYKNFYRIYDTPPKPTNNREISDIIKNIKIPNNMVNENGEYIHVHGVTVVAIIDKSGKAITYGISEKSIDQFDVYEKIVLREFEKEKEWIPATLKGENIPVYYIISFNIHYKTN